MTVDIFDSAGKLSGILITVIYSRYQAVFKCDPAPRFFKIMTTGLQNLIHTVFIGNRHQFPAFYIIWRMKGKCKCHLKFLFCKIINLRNQSTGGNSQVSLTDMKPAIFCQDMYKPKKIFIIIKGFSCSHHYNI